MTMMPPNVTITGTPEPIVLTKGLEIGRADISNNYHFWLKNLHPEDEYIRQFLTEKMHVNEINHQIDVTGISEMYALHFYKDLPPIILSGGKISDYKQKLLDNIVLVEQSRKLRPETVSFPQILNAFDKSDQSTHFNETLVLHGQDILHPDKGESYLTLFQSDSNILILGAVSKSYFYNQIGQFMPVFDMKPVKVVERNVHTPAE